MGDYFSFRSLVTPVVMRIAYVLGAIVVTVLALPVYYAVQRSTLDDTRAFLAALVVAIGGNLAWRILCELAIILFSIHDRLVELTSSSGSARPTKGVAKSEEPVYDAAALEAATRAAMRED